MICGSSNGVDEDIAVLERELARLGEGVVDDLAVEDDIRAVAGGLRRPSPSGVGSGMTIVAGMPSRLAW